jgi:hypothetical protein
LSPGYRGKQDGWKGLTATFGFKDRYSDQEIEAVCKELVALPVSSARKSSAGGRGDAITARRQPSAR